MQAIVSLVLSAIAVLVSAYVVPGVEVSSWFSALVVAVVLALVNAFIRPIVSLLTLPINVLTLGLFSLVISALMILLTAQIVSGFQVNGFVTAFIFGLVLSLVNSLIFALLPGADND